MLRPSSNSCTNRNHGLRFFIDGAEITVDEMGHWVASMVHWPSESRQEEFARDAAHTIFMGVAGKVEMSKAMAERVRVRKEWVKRNPPNHAGYYYCHIGGEWVHIDAMELDHVTPSSVQTIDMENDPEWEDKLRPSCHVHNFQKGSRQDIPSATLVIAPPDDGC